MFKNYQGQGWCDSEWTTLQAKWWSDTEQTTFGLKTLASEQLTWRSKGIIHFLRSSLYWVLVTVKQKSQNGAEKNWSRKQNDQPNDQQPDRPTDGNKYDSLLLLSNKIISFLAEVKTKTHGYLSRAGCLFVWPSVWCWLSRELSPILLYP